MKLAFVCLLAVCASAGLQLPTLAVAQSSQVVLTLRVPAAIIETSRRECRLMASQHVARSMQASETDEIRAVLDSYCMDTARDAIRDIAEGVADAYPPVSGSRAAYSRQAAACRSSTVFPWLRDWPPARGYGRVNACGFRLVRRRTHSARLIPLPKLSQHLSARTPQPRATRHKTGICRTETRGRLVHEHVCRP